MKYNYIKTECRDHVYYLTLARPEKRNAFTPGMVDEIAQAIAEANESSNIALVVFQAEGPVFCAGMDLKTYQDPEQDIAHSRIGKADTSLGFVMESLNKPSLAIVRGPVIAGGFLFLLGCTYVLAEESVTFRLPEVDLGIFPFQVLPGLCRILPEKKAFQLCLDSEPFDMEKAMAYGVVDGLASDAEIQKIISSFSHTNVAMLESAMKAKRAIRTMETEDQYRYLLTRLEELKTMPDVKIRVNQTLKKS